MKAVQPITRVRRSDPEDADRTGTTSRKIGEPTAGGSHRGNCHEKGGGGRDRSRAGRVARLWRRRHDSAVRGARNAKYVADFVLCAAAARAQLLHLVQICDAINFIDAGALVLTDLRSRLRALTWNFISPRVKARWWTGLPNSVSQTSRVRTRLPADGAGYAEA